MKCDILRKIQLSLVLFIITLPAFSQSYAVKIPAQRILYKTSTKEEILSGYRKNTEMMLLKNEYKALIDSCIVYEQYFYDEAKTLLNENLSNQLSSILQPTKEISYRHFSNASQSLEAEKWKDVDNYISLFQNNFNIYFRTLDSMCLFNKIKYAIPNSVENLKKSEAINSAVQHKKKQLESVNNIQKESILLSVASFKKNKDGFFLRLQPDKYARSEDNHTWDSDLGIVYNVKDVEGKLKEKSVYRDYDIKANFFIEKDSIIKDDSIIQEYLSVKNALKYIIRPSNLTLSAGNTLWTETVEDTVIAGPDNSFSYYTSVRYFMMENEKMNGVTVYHIRYNAKPETFLSSKEIKGNGNIKGDLYYNIQTGLLVKAIDNSEFNLTVSENDGTQIPLYINNKKVIEALTN